MELPEKFKHGKRDIIIEMEYDEYNKLLSKKLDLRLTWKEILMKGADNL